MKLRTQVFALATAIMLSAGCAPYRLGTTLPPNLRHVYVPSVKNASTEPGIDTTATTALQREIQREGTLSISSEAESTTTLEITVVRVKQEPVRYERDDTLTPDEYRIVVAAEILFKNNVDGKPLYKGIVEGESVYIAGADLITAKQTRLPLACNDLARRIVDNCTSIWAAE